jgi:hypothetical protein
MTSTIVLQRAFDDQEMGSDAWYINSEENGKAEGGRSTTSMGKALGAADRRSSMS